MQPRLSRTAVGTKEKNTMPRQKALQIAIDGPVAAGKSTVAQLLAKRLGLIYIDTGAMYRATALAGKRMGLNWHDEAAMSELTPTLTIRLARPTGAKNDGRTVTVYLGDDDVSWEIRETEMGEGASIIGQYQLVRKALVKKQQQLARGKRVVMEGRDIGIRVLPNAHLKIYLDAKLNERVKRKQEQLEKIGEDLSPKEVKHSIVIRDEREMNREVDPLKPAPDAWVFDTSGLSIEEVVEQIAARALAAS